MTPWTIDTAALASANVAMSTDGDVATFSWGPADDPTTATVHVVAGDANFFPERSAQQTALMTVLGLLTP
jgi:hypothetical protein